MSRSDNIVARLDLLGSRWWFTDAVWLGVCVTIVLSAVLLDPSRQLVQLFGLDVPVLCTWRQLTGMSCPGCGLTRSFTFMAHGQVIEAFHMNWAGPILFSIVAVQLPWRGFKLARGHRVEDPG